MIEVRRATLIRLPGQPAPGQRTIAALKTTSGILGGIATAGAVVELIPVPLVPLLGAFLKGAASWQGYVNRKTAQLEQNPLGQPL